MKKLSGVLLKINFLLAAIVFILCGLYSCKSHAKDVIKVMVIDSGIGEHNLLNSYVQYDSSDNYQDAFGHGTQVTGIILFGNRNKNKDRMIFDPVCHRVKIYSCRYYIPKPFLSFGGEDLATGRLEIDCIKRATREGMDIINISGGGIAYDPTEYAAMKEFTEKGGLAVVSAGNTGKELSELPFYPASYKMHVKEKRKVKKVYEDAKKGTAMTMTGEVEEDKFTPLKNIIVVSSTEANGAYAATSARDPQAIKEIGVDILSTKPDNKYGMISGTSAAAPAWLHKFLIYACKRMEK